MFKKLWMALCSILILGCSTSPQVHIFGQYLDETQLQQLTRSLQQHNYNVTVNDHYFPKDLSGNTLIHSTTALSQRQLEELVQLLETQGYGYVASRFVGTGKHRYTGDNLGLYLFGNRYQEISQALVANFSNEYSATGCAEAIYADLMLRSSRETELVLGFDGPGGSKELTKSGRWWNEDEQLFVHLGDDFTVVFSIEEIIETTPYGKRVGWRLSPQSGAWQVDYCQFEFTQVIDS